MHDQRARAINHAELARPRRRAIWVLPGTVSGGRPVEDGPQPENWPQAARAALPQRPVGPLCGSRETSRLRSLVPLGDPGRHDLVPDGRVHPGLPCSAGGLSPWAAAGPAHLPADDQGRQHHAPVPPCRYGGPQRAPDT